MLIQIHTFSTILFSVTFTYEPNNQFYYEQEIYSCTSYSYTRNLGNGKSVIKKNDDPKAKYQRILRNVGIVLEQGHYSPKKIDDKFSQEVLTKFQESLDPDKYIFLQKDIDAFKKYANTIDNEIHGTPTNLFTPSAIPICYAQTKFQKFIKRF